MFSRRPTPDTVAAANARLRRIHSPPGQVVGGAGTVPAPVAAPVRPPGASLSAIGSALPEPSEPGDWRSEQRPAGSQSVAADWIVAPEEFAVRTPRDPVLVEGPPDLTANPRQADRAADLQAAASADHADGLWRSPRPSWRERLGGAFEALVPASLRGARLDPGRRGVAAIAVIALFAATLAGVAAWRARPEPVIVPTPVPDEVSASPSGGSVVVVAVAGKVRRPGLVRLPAGSRVADALDAAGGVLPGVDAGPINLARKLVDGELVVVGPPAGAAPPGSASPDAPRAPGGSLLDLNTATAEQLDGLPGVGRVLAQRIVEYRTAHGGFRSVDQLREVDGIGEGRFQKLRGLVTV